MRYVLYNHVGSANHGCEALVRSIKKVLSNDNVLLISESPDEETTYGIDKIVSVKSALSNKISFTKKAFAYLQLKCKNNYFYMDALPYLETISKLSRDDILISIGGDIYCYDNYPKHILLHKFAKKFVKKTVLLGCSIEPDLLNDNELIRDLKSYDLITARETITLNALKSAGITQVVYFPDTAFLLDKKEIALPLNFQKGNTVGLNLSPLVLKKSQNANLLMDNYRVLINHIISTTDKSIALIPHVSWKDNNDSEPLSMLFSEFRDSKRICLLPNMKAEEIKYCISCCDSFIGARTHATIAAYSSCVPTLVLGYSVKSRGIARDLFGKEEHYVLSYNSINNNDDLLNEYLWIQNNQKEIKETLNKGIKSYTSILNSLRKQIQSIVQVE